MLEVLHIENIAIIEEADIRFEAGFNALTGETGAGKSIVIDALSAVLGQRTSRELIRTGADKAFVSAVFSGVDSAIAEEQGVTPEEDGSLLLQREIHSDGKSVCRVGGRPVTVGQLKALGSRLLNIHGQHDGQQLLDEEQHLQFLDSFGKLESLINTYAEKYNSFTATQRKIQSLQMDESEKARRVDTLTYQINELERAKLRAGEEEELAARRNLLRNAEKFTSAVAEADYALNGDDSGDGALGMLRRAQDAVGAVRHLDDDYAGLYQRLEALYSEAYDVAATIEDKREGFDFSPNELDDVESRLDQLYRLKRSTAPAWRTCWPIWSAAAPSWSRSSTPVMRWHSWSGSWARRRRKPLVRRRLCPRGGGRRRSGCPPRSWRSCGSWTWAGSGSPWTSQRSLSAPMAWTRCGS